LTGESLNRVSFKLPALPASNPSQGKQSSSSSRQAPTQVKFRGLGSRRFAMTDKSRDIWEGFEENKEISAIVREISKTVLEIIRNIAVLSLLAFAARTTKDPVLIALFIVGELAFIAHCFSFMAPYIWHPRPRSPTWRARAYIGIIVFMTIGVSLFLMFVLSASIDTLVQLQRTR
jgi:hypothetical protein